MRPLVFTFRTYPHINRLKELFDNVVVLGTLKEDLFLLKKTIKKEKPSSIRGIAQSEKDYSTIEPVTVNKFNNGIVLTEDKEKLSLSVPKNHPFKESSKPTTSFCNYAMYTIQNFLDKEGLDIPFTFVHVKEEDIDKTVTLIN